MILDPGQATYLLGDVFDRLAEMPDGGVDLVLTSPPFLALRSYLPADHPDKAKEIGSEPTPAEFLDTLLALTAEWGRVLAPHGSIAVELGDTYAGSGGGGGDYNAEGLRDGQAKFDGSARRNCDAAGWPLDKSLCVIPELYAACLAYGRNVLTGAESPAGQWRVRSMVRWVRPNPPVGALGDKYRPATSVMTVACRARDRWFDLDAVRTGLTERAKAEEAAGGVRGGESYQGEAADGTGYSGQRTRRPAAGGVAPPLDWWEIPTQPYKGSHYATWPPALCERPIKSMCPTEVCTSCGEPRRRITEDDWTVCDCPDPTYRPGIVLDPFAGSGTTLAVATGHGRAAIGIDLDARNADLALERVGPLALTVHQPGEAP